MHPMNHMAGPHSLWEYVVVACAVVILIWVFYLGIKYTFWPGEEQPDHIKRKILEPDESQLASSQPPQGREDAPHSAVSSVPESRPYPPKSR